MTRRLACLVVLLLACAPAARAQAPFEGVATLSVFGGQGEPRIPVTYMTKGVRSRIEYEVTVEGFTGRVVMLVDHGRGRVTSVLPGTKDYTVSDIDLIAKPLLDKVQPPFVATGRKETVAGHSCEHYTVKSGEKSLDFCVASDLGHLFFGAVPTPRSGILSAEMTKHFPRGFFPLKGTGPQRELMLEVSRIERKSLADALFVLPAGYKEIKLPFPTNP